MSRFRARLPNKNSLFPPSFARVASLIRKMRTAHFRGNAWQKCDFAALDIKQKTKRKRAGAAQAASAFSFFACLRGKPDPLRCCFPLFPRRVARERGSPFPRKFTPFRLRCAPCGTVVPLNVTLGKSVILPRFITLFWVQRHAAARLTRKNSRFPPSFARVASLIRKTCTASFRGNGVENAIFNALIKFFLMRRRQPQRLRSAALRQYEQTFHVPSRRAAV